MVMLQMLGLHLEDIDNLGMVVKVEYGVLKNISKSKQSQDGNN
jgi:hypothetical protein